MISLYVDGDAADQLLLQTVHETSTDFWVVFAMNGPEALRYPDRAKKTPEGGPGWF